MAKKKIAAGETTTSESVQSTAAGEPAKTVVRKKKKARRRARGGGLASASLTALQAELGRRLETLQTKREQLVEELEALDAEIAGFHEAMSLPAGPARRGRKKVVRRGKKAGRPRKKLAKRKTARRKKTSKKKTARRAQNKLSLVAALQEVLKGKTLSVAEMESAVKKKGYRSSSDNFRGIINQALVKNTDVFKRVERGRYKVR